LERTDAQSGSEEIWNDVIKLKSWLTDFEAERLIMIEEFHDEARDKKRDDEKSFKKFSKKAVVWRSQ
jgi:hypothetical protein